uniref:CSON008086 protein n=1 Tax=Culicoides sonorensis TaxID=179676 RepID=A0A336MV61_CULSO
MNTNRNLHSTKVLTEFARDFDDEEDTGILSQFVNKISNIVNTNYNSLSGYPSTSTNIETGEDGKKEGSGENSPKREGDVKEKQEKVVLQPEKPDELPLDSESAAGRTPLNVIRRISNLIAQKDNSLHNYKDTDLHKFWMPDSKSKECYECCQKFTTFRRKHHCRLCGQIFCSKCCNQVVPGKIIMCSGDLKVCTYCSKVVLSYLKSPDITADLKSDLQALQADLSTKFSSPISNQSNQGPTLAPNDAHLLRHRKISVGYHEERHVSSPNLTHADRRSILQQSNTIKMLYEDMMKALPHFNRGRDLVSYLINTHKSGDHEEAVAILNAIIGAGYLVPLIEVNENETEPEPQDVSIFPTFNENLVYKSGNVVESQNESKNKDGDGNYVQLRHSLTATSEEGPMLSTTPDSSLYNVAKDFEAQDSIFASVGAKPLTESFCEHEEQLLCNSTPPKRPLGRIMVKDPHQHQCSCRQSNSSRNRLFRFNGHP